MLASPPPFDDEPAEDVDEGRLAGAVGAEQTKERAARDLQIDALQRVLRRRLRLGRGRFCRALARFDGVVGRGGGREHGMFRGRGQSRIARSSDALGTGALLIRFKPHRRMAKLPQSTHRRKCHARRPDARPARGHTKSRHAA